MRVASLCSLVIGSAIVAHPAACQPATVASACSCPTVMTRSRNTLTMDPGGHLFPGQEADAVVRCGERLDAVPVKGTDDGATEAERPGRDSVRAGCRLKKFLSGLTKNMAGWLL